MSDYFVDEDQCTHRAIFPGVEIFTAAANEMMLSCVDLEPGAEVKEHSHPHEQVGTMVAGRARFYIGDEQRILGPGDMYRIPGGVLHRVVALEEGAKAVDVFHPIREDYL